MLSKQVWKMLGFFITGLLRAFGVLDVDWGFFPFFLDDGLLIKHTTED